MGCFEIFQHKLWQSAHATQVHTKTDSLGTVLGVSTIGQKPKFPCRINQGFAYLPISHEYQAYTTDAKTALHEAA